MKAVICNAYGPPENLEVEDIPAPTAGAGQVVVEVRAAGVNFPDLLMCQGLYQIKPPPPFSPGGEVAGLVAEVGTGVSGVRVGDRVMVLTGFGGFAERIATSPDRLVPIPDGMDFETAGGFMFTYATSHHALRDRARIRPGETMLVLGAAGGVGLTAVELGTQMGLRVIAAASSPEKLELCKQYGAVETIDYSREDLKQRLKALGGVDLVYDPVGGPYTEAALRGLRPSGRLLVIGFAAGQIPAIPLNLTLLKECEIVGVAWGAFAMRNPDRHAANMKELLDFYGSGRLRPFVQKVRPFAEAKLALRDMAERKVMGKVVLVPST